VWLLEAPNEQPAAATSVISDPAHAVRLDSERLIVGGVFPAPPCPHAVDTVRAKTAAKNNFSIVCYFIHFIYFSMAVSKNNSLS
jgi:hypothetical protein